LFGLVDRTALEQLTRQDPATFEPLDKARIQRVLDLAVWIDMYRPEIAF
jgi:asparagine synthase (glutamine-hydrolysing)